MEVRTMTQPDENDSLTRRQIEILRGRPVDDLSPLEKLDFANAAPRPIAADKHIPEEDRFKVSARLLEGVHPLVKLDVANGADRMGRIRQRRRQIRAELASLADTMRRHALEHEDGELSKEGAALYAQIGRYEDRSAVAH